VNHRLLILSADKVFPHFEQTEAAGIKFDGDTGALQSGNVNYHIARLLDVYGGIS
jgi:hypothetical protein